MLQRIAQLFRKTLTPYPLNILFKRRGQRTAIGIFTTSMG